MMIFIPLVFCGVTVSAIVTQQSFFRILPLYFSFWIFYLHSRVNRYGALIGSFNSILYGFVYLHYNLYGSALQAFLLSFPTQLLTFILWSKRPYKKSTIFRVMSTRTRLLTLFGSVLAYAVYVFMMKDTDANHLYLDGALLIAGIVSLIIEIFASIEYAYIPIVTGLISMSMYVLLTVETPEQLPYLIFSLYSYVCYIRRLYNVKKLYKEQQGVV